MPTLLHLDSSADLVNSRSRAIGRTFSEAWTSAHPDNVVVYRDLLQDPLPHLPDAALHWPRRLWPEHAAPPADAESLQQELLAELLGADVLLVDAPMYNFSLPSTLKAWIDYIHVPGVTAPFDDATQPLAGRQAVIVASRGGVYDPDTPTADWDHAVPVLKIILGHALGMSVSVISTNLTLAEVIPARVDDIPRAERELAEAHVAAAELGRQLGSHAG